MAFGDFTVDRNSTKYVLGSSGTIVPVATDEPAIEFNADGTYKGLLVEPAATNLLTYSDVDSADWNRLDGNSQVTSDAAVSPDGTTNADKLEAANTSSVQKIIRKSYSSSGENTFSIYAKAAEVSYFQIDFTDSRYAIFDITAGSGSVVSSAGSTYASIEDVGNGWYRCIVTTTVNSNFIDVQLYNGTSLTFSASIGDGIYLWGAQLETGPIATSYIPTSGSTVTRNKDDITLGSASSLIGQTEGTLYVEVDWRLASGTFQKLLAVSDGTSNNRMLIYNSSGGELRMLAQANGGAEETNQGASSSGYSGIQKIAFAYADSDFELYRNGLSISSDIDPADSLAALATMTDIDLGQGWNAAGQANMHIRAVAIYPTRLGAGDLINLTGDNPNLFVTTWKTDNAGTSGSNQITLPLVNGGTYDFYVNWGDNTTSDHITAYNQAEVTHTYASAGTYTVRIFGTIRGFRFQNGGDKLKILTIESYGPLDISTNGSFWGCTNLTSTATDAPTISTTTLDATFTNCQNFNGAIGNWDVSGVTVLQYMFSGAASFNQDIGSWDVSNATTMSNMFTNAQSFNQDIGSWDVSSVTNMVNMLFNNDAMSAANLGAVKNWTITALTNGQNFQALCANSMSTEDYNALLIAWEAQTHNNNVTIHFNQAVRSSASDTAFNQLIADGWTITDSSGTTP